MWSAPGYSVACQLEEHTVQQYPNMTFDPIISQLHNNEPPGVDDESIVQEDTDQAPTILTTHQQTDTMLVPWLSQGGQEEQENTKLKETASQIQRELQREINNPGKEALSMEAANQLDLMSWHTRLGLIQMSKLQRIASAGMLPNNIASCRQPLCQACIYGMMVKRAWKTKQTPHSIAPDTSRPGEHVSVDQIESPVPGLIAQLKGKPTIARYSFTTVFVDTFSRASYVHLQQTSNAEETHQAKKNFEAFSQTHGVHIRHYHTDNGRFVDNLWKTHAQLMVQTYSNSGVGAHHQNGIVEKRIRDLQDLARSSLIHAIRRWTDSITTQLWPYALRNANVAINQLLPPKAISAPINVFSNLKGMLELKYKHPFGCPAYVLDRKMQSGMKGYKWESQARIGVYVGNSEYYANNVSLVLSLSSGMVTPQFHVKHDDNFITLSHHMGNVIPKSQWQSKCGFLEATRNKYKYIGVKDIQLTDNRAQNEIQ